MMRVFSLTFGTAAALQLHAETEEGATYEASYDYGGGHHDDHYHDDHHHDDHGHVVENIVWGNVKQIQQLAYYLEELQHYEGSLSHAAAVLQTAHSNVEEAEKDRAKAEKKLAKKNKAFKNIQKGIKELKSKRKKNKKQIAKWEGKLEDAFHLIAQRQWELDHATKQDAISSFVSDQYEAINNHKSKRCQHTESMLNHISEMANKGGSCGHADCRQLCNQALEYIPGDFCKGLATLECH